MCNKAMDEDFLNLEYVFVKYKTQKLCSNAVEEDPYTLKYFPDSIRPKRYLS